MTNEFEPEVHKYFEGFLGNFEAVKHRTDIEALARCPDPDGLHSNGDETPSLSIGLSQNGKGPTILVNCLSQGCSKEEILSALGLDLKDLYPNERSSFNGSANGSAKNAISGCTLEEYAAYKNLPIEFLTGGVVGLSETKYWDKPAVHIPYPNEDGDVIAERFRVNLKKPKTGPDDRFRWKKGAHPALYGLHGLDDAREAGYVLLVEGESDCHVLWYHDIPALGIPGAKSWKEEWVRYLDGIGTLLVAVEPDAAGEQLWSTLVGSAELAPRLEKVRFTDAI